MATINAPPPPPIQGARIVSYMIRSDERVQPDIDGLNGTPLKKSWRLCCLPTPKTERESSIWGRIQSTPGIYAAGISNNGKFNEIAVDLSYIPWLFTHKFNLNLDYDPTEPADKDVLYYGAFEAKARANTHFLGIAVKACRSGLRKLRPCFLGIAQSLGLRIPLEWAILNHDILESDQVCEKFTKNLVILGLNFLQIYNTSHALELLSKDHGELLQLVVDQSETESRRPSCQEMQMISLVRLLFEFSGGREDFNQHKFDKEFTADENANLCRDLLGIPGSNFFGRFDTQNILEALSTSKVFTDKDLQEINIVELSIQMIEFLPIGYQKGYLDLPDLVLHKLGVGCVNEIGIYIEHFYHDQPSLRLPENNVLLLLTWSSMAAGHPIEFLSEWAASEDGLRLYQRSTRDVQTSHKIEQLALTLAALTCHKRLLPYSLNDSAQSIRGSYLSDFDALIKGKRLPNERAVLERMSVSLLRVLETFMDDFRNICGLLAMVLTTPRPMLHRFDGFSDEYWLHRTCGLSHEKYFETNIHHKMDHVVTLDVDEEGWTVVGRLN